VLLTLALFAHPAWADDDDDDDDEDGISFGVTPWFHMGPSWTTWGGDAVKGTVRNGLTVELTGQALVVLPGQRFGVGAVAGYFGTGGRIPETDDEVSFTGFQVMPLVMISLVDQLSIHLKGGYLVGAVNDAETGAGAVRFGGGLTFVFLRMHAGDLALSADVTHTRVLAVEVGPLPQFAATSGQLGLSVAFDPSIL
jgi:hypothetical protein